MTQMTTCQTTQKTQMTTCQTTKIRSQMTSDDTNDNLSNDTKDIVKRHR
jgi:hypothetical protein